MKPYTKRPITIYAHRLAYEDFTDDHPNPNLIKGVTYYPKQMEAAIPTLEGTMFARVGDWIVKGIHGELYPVKHEIFMDSYDPAVPVDPEFD